MWARITALAMLALPLAAAPASPPAAPARERVRGTCIGAVVQWTGEGDAWLCGLTGQFYARPWLSLHHGLLLMDSNAWERGFAGLDYGLRANWPGRFSPFAGIAGYLAYNTRRVRHERRETQEYLLALRPEAGCQFWISSGLKIAVIGSCSLATDPATDPLWMYGVEVATSF